jgi:isoquinoline 1-oxidoreductase beta subunit
MNVKVNRRSFIKVSSLVSGGLVLGFSWGSCTRPEEIVSMPKEWFDLNGFLKIGDNGLVTIMSPNPEIGQNVKTSMPMIIAEELDVDWKNVIVEQAPFNPEIFENQVAGGSQSIRSGWTSLRTTGATARQMLVNAAAKQWEVDPSTLRTEAGYVYNGNEKLGYGELAALASGMEVPSSEDVKLKEVKDFKLIGTEVPNVDIDKIITGEPLFGLDYKEDGMVYACLQRPYSFGDSIGSFDDSEARQVTGVLDVVQIGEKVAVIAESTWAAIKGKNALTVNWKKGEKQESTDDHDKILMDLLEGSSFETLRKDGNVAQAFREADQVIEKVYESPFLPHNCMEPMNFFASVTDDKVRLVGPIQTPQWTVSRVAKELGREVADVSCDMTRMGGGFGRRLYGDFAIEAAQVSDKIRKPVKVVFTREDDMTAGTYRPSIKYKIAASIKDNQITGYHLKEAAVNGNMYGLIPNFFPAGAIENYQVDVANYKSNITTGAWRAPYTNFLSFAEQSFFDELAEIMEVDRVKLHLDLLAKVDPSKDDKIQYSPERLAGVLKLVVEKAGWGKAPEGTYQGMSVYYCHNTHVAEIADVELVNGNPVVKKVTCAIDCGIVVNRLGATNQAEGGVVDGVGHAMYSDFKFENGRANHENFNTYRLIRMPEAPKVDVHFVKNEIDPTGLGEPTLPPAGAAVANAFFKAGKARLYKQPFVQNKDIVG